jgi:hypothetical protein
MPAVDAIVRRGDRGKRVTSGPNALEGPKAARSRSPFSSITRITGSTDFYEVTNPYGLAPGNYTIYVRPVNRNGLSLDGVGRVAVVKQAGGRDNPNVTAALVALKRPNSVDSPLVLGPFAVTTADRLFVVLERKGVAEVKYQLQLEGPDSALRDELWAKAGAVPSLDLRLATSKSLVDSVSGQNLVTFTRASSGTYVDADGLIKTAANNVPRFDHNPVTGESLGLLVEEQRTNLLLRSEEFETTWTATRATITTNAGTAPNGTQTADKLILDATANNSHFVQQVPSITAGSQYVASLYVKAAEYQFLRLELLGNVSTGDLITRGFNVSTGAALSAISVTGSAVAGATGIEALSNGWYRVWIGGTLNGTDTAARLRILLGSSTGGALVNGDGTSGTYIWGAQLEAGAFPTSYIPTTDSAVTRSADVASISGSNFSSWFNANEGCVYAEWLSTGSNSFANVYQFHDNVPTVNLLEAYRANSDSAITARIRESGGTQQTLAFTSQQWLNKGNKIATSYAVDNYRGSINGSTPLSDTSLALPTVSVLILGTAQAQAPANYLSGTIKRFTYWPRFLQEATIQTLTQ